MNNETLYADYSMARFTGAQLLTGGYSGRIRYFGRYAPKVLERSEVADSKRYGVDLLTVYEDAADSALGGYNVGRDHAQRANLQAEAVGYPAAAAVYFAVDFDAQEPQLAVIGDYFRGACSVSAHPVGVYGSLRVVESVTSICSYVWQTQAWSGRPISKYANLYQRTYPTRKPSGAAAGSWDENLVLGDCGAWKLKPAPAPAPVPDPKPKPHGEPMVYVIKLTDGRMFKSNLIDCVQIPTEYEYKLTLVYAVAAGGPSADVHSGPGADPQNLHMWGKRS